MTAPHVQSKREAIYADAQKIIMDSALWLPIHNPAVHRASREKAARNWPA